MPRVETKHVEVCPPHLQNIAHRTTSLLGRCNIFEKSIIPRTLTTINYIKGELEDKEREDMFRISIVKHKRNKDLNIIIKQKAPIAKELVTEEILANTMLETNIKKEEISRPLNPISKFNLLWLNFARQPFSQIVMLTSELKRKQVMDPGPSYDYKIPKRNSGHIVISDHEKCHLPLQEFSSIPNVADNLVVIKASEESYNEDKFIPPLGFNILVGMSEVVDLFSDDISNDILEKLNKSELSNGTIAFQFSSNILTIPTPISIGLNQIPFDMSGLKYVIITLSKLRTKWSSEFIRAIQCALKFFHLPDPDSIDFCFDEQEKPYNLKIVGSTETDTALIISEPNDNAMREDNSIIKSIQELKLLADRGLRGEGLENDRDKRIEDDGNDDEKLKRNSSD